MPRPVAYSGIEWPASALSTGFAAAPSVKGPCKPLETTTAD
jgi:hypothetical protein